jgi:DNA-binding CsgD family transcriptional regulator
VSGPHNRSLLMSGVNTERIRREFARLLERSRDRVGVFREASRLMRRVVAFDGASWHSHDPTTLLMTGAYKHDMTSENFPLFAENENAQPDVNKFRDLGRCGPRAQTLLRATGGEPQQSARYREIFRGMGIEHELRASFREGSACWGSVALVRRRGREDFSQTDVAFVATVAPSIARALRRAVVTRGEFGGATTDAPGIVLVDVWRGIDTVTPAAVRWLEELAEPDAFPLSNGALPVALADVVASARAGTGQGARVRARTRLGRWLLIHAYLLEGRDGRAAVIIEPAPRSTVAPLVAAGYGITERERDILELILRGYSTAEIATTLFISPYTVKDHLKSIFEKTSTRTRGELVSRVFWQDCAPRMDLGIL